MKHLILKIRMKIYEQLILQCINLHVKIGVLDNHNSYLDTGNGFAKVLRELRNKERINCKFEALKYKR